MSDTPLPCTGTPPSSSTQGGSDSSNSSKGNSGSGGGWHRWLWTSVTNIWSNHVFLAYPRSAVLWIVWTYCRLQSKYQLLQKQWQPSPVAATGATRRDTCSSLSRIGNAGGDGEGGVMSSRCHLNVGAGCSWTLQNYRRQEVRELVTEMTETSSVPSHSLLTRFYVDYTKPVEEEDEGRGAMSAPAPRRITRIFFSPHLFLRHLDGNDCEGQPRSTSLTVQDSLQTSPLPQIFMVMYYAQRLQASPNEVPIRLWWTAQDAATYIHAGNHLFTREMVFEMLLRQYKRTPEKVAEVWRPDDYELQVFLTGMQLYLSKNDYVEVVSRKQASAAEGKRVLVFVKRSGHDPDKDEEMEELEEMEGLEELE